jgi:hypothetical protein
VNITNLNIGIERLPNSNNHTTTIAQPAVNSLVTLNGGSNPPVLSGSDPEDCNSGCTLSGRSLIIDAVPTNSELYYMGTLVTAGQQINNLNPAQLQVRITAITMSFTSTSFTYSFVDAAGKKDPTPATYALNWFQVLPVTGLAATARLDGKVAIIDWKTETENNSSHFLVERSLDNLAFTTVGTVGATGNSNTARYYTFRDDISAVMQQDIIYYRVRQVDIDTRIKFSNIATVRLSKITRLQAWPNPFSESISLAITSPIAEVFIVKLTNANGQVVQSRKVTLIRGANQITIRQLENLPSGVYLLLVRDQTGAIRFNEKFIKE